MNHDPNHDLKMLSLAYAVDTRDAALFVAVAASVNWRKCEEDELQQALHNASELGLGWLADHLCTVGMGRFPESSWGYDPDSLPPTGVSTVVIEEIGRGKENVFMDPSYEARLKEQMEKSLESIAASEHVKPVGGRKPKKEKE